MLVLMLAVQRHIKSPKPDLCISVTSAIQELPSPMCSTFVLARKEGRKEDHVLFLILPIQYVTDYYKKWNLKIVLPMCVVSCM